MCAGATVLARLDRLVYGAKDPKFGGCVSLYDIPSDARMNHQIDMVGGILAEQAVALMQKFFVQQRLKSARRA